MTKAASAPVERDLSRIGWIDYLLMCIGSCLAVYSGGMSIQLPALSYFAMALVIVGTTTSYMIRYVTFKSPVIKWDGFIYTGAMICAIFFSGELSGMMPDHGFPREIAAAGWLSWMLILGSFATWQDTTLLFQAIPALALFGLVGCYDTFRGVTFDFFAFLICLATLFARAHGRQMLRQAAQSGYFTRGLAPGTPIPSVETTPGLAQKLKHGPWRWLAGPEWALLSALAVVLISLLGAPVVQQSVSGVAGMVVLPPPPMHSLPSELPVSSDPAQGSVRIGIGPNHSARSTAPVLDATLDKLRYLREETFTTYTNRGWRNLSNGVVSQQANPTQVAIADMNKSDTYRFEIVLRKSLRILPLPAEPAQWELEPPVQPTSVDGSFYLPSAASDSYVGLKATGESMEISSSVQPTTAENRPELAAIMDVQGIPARVVKLALDVAKNGKTDYDKAKLIQSEIARRITYNLDAAAVPDGDDPVEYTLFNSHEAYCDLSASSMVLMARAVGIPARYVQGYLPSENSVSPTGAFVVRDSDYHAWAELMFKDVGWVVFDPTLNEDAVPGEGIGDVGDPRPWYRKGFVLFATNLLIAALVIAVGWLAFVQIKLNKRSVDPKSDLDKAYVLFGKRMERAAKRRRTMGQTPDEFLESVRPHLGSTYGMAQALNTRFVRMMYSNDPISRDSVSSLRSQTREFGKALDLESKSPRAAAS